MTKALPPRRKYEFLADRVRLSLLASSRFVLFYSFIISQTRCLIQEIERAKFGGTTAHTLFCSKGDFDQVPISSVLNQLVYLNDR